MDSSQDSLVRKIDGLYPSEQGAKPCPGSCENCVGELTKSTQKKMNIVDTDEVKKLRTSSWATKTGSPYCCVQCGKYVGWDHVLYPREYGCRLGSEVPRIHVEALEVERLRGMAEHVEWFLQGRRENG